MKLKYQPTEPLKQTPHIVAFLDFLGASEKMRDPVKNDKFLQEINSVYMRAKISKDINPQLKIKIFSDNIVVAEEIPYPNNPDSVADTYWSVENFSSMLYTAAMVTGNFMRGAISTGLLYIDDTLVYGEALLNAHDGESKIANYPRIVIDKTIFVNAKMDDMWKTFNPPDKENMILRDMDGELYLNPFWGIPKVSEHNRKREEQFLAYVAETIIKEYKELFSKSKKTVFPKYHWLANQFNEYCHANNHPFLINLDKLTLEGKNE